MDVIKLAKEAGWDDRLGFSGVEMPDFFERFAALVAAHEREACAKVCEKSSYSDEGDYFLESRAAAIRSLK